jgi:hypothetical protein
MPALDLEHIGAGQRAEQDGVPACSAAFSISKMIARRARAWTALRAASLSKRPSFIAIFSDVAKTRCAEAIIVVRSGEM